MPAARGCGIYLERAAARGDRRPCGASYQVGHSANPAAMAPPRRAHSRVACKLSWLAGEEAENSLISFGTTLWASGTTRGWKAILSVRAEALAVRNWTGYAKPWRFTPTGVGSGWHVNFASGGSGARPKAD